MIPAVSVVVPVYNAQMYLEKCLDSIVAQTLTNIQIICVNDGSTDCSQSILEQYQEKDPRISVIVQENQGLSCARNRGMKEADGEYISFVDSDDFIAPEMLETLYRLAKREAADIAICDVFLYDHNTERCSTYRDQALYARLNEMCTDVVNCPKLIAQIGAWDRIYLRSFLLDIGAQFPRGLIYEDAAFTAETLTQAKRVAVTSQKLYYYRKNAGASITDREAINDHYKQSFLDIQSLMLQSMKKGPQHPDIYSEYLQYCMSNAFAHQMNATTPEFFNHFFSGVRQLLTQESYMILAHSAPIKIRVYSFFLKHDLASLCRGFFVVWKLCRSILKK